MWKPHPTSAESAQTMSSLISKRPLTEYGMQPYGPQYRSTISVQIQFAPLSSSTTRLQVQSISKACTLFSNSAVKDHDSLFYSILSPITLEGRRGTKDDSQQSLSILSCFSPLVELAKSIPVLFDIVFPPLLLTASFSLSLHCAL